MNKKQNQFFNKDIFSGITRFSETHALIAPGSHIILGLSGGADSVFLLHYLLSIKQENNISLIAAHLNHEWRDSSDADETFCKRLAQQHAIPFISERISTLKNKPAVKSSSKEVIGRIMRRHFLESVCKEYNTDVIALAHHADDQQETFFIRLLRGASITGLSAMRPQSGLYVRPLLTTYKKDIVAYLETHKIPFVEDPSNESPEFLRNRIRKTVIPALRACDKRFDQSFAQTLTRIQEADDFLHKYTIEIFSAITAIEDNRIKLSTRFLADQDPVIQHRLLVYWFTQENIQFPPTKAFLDEALRFLLSLEGGVHAIHPAWSLVKKGRWVSIKK